MRDSIRAGIEAFSVEKCGAAQGIIILLPAYTEITPRLVEPDCGRVCNLDVQADLGRARQLRRAFDAAKQLTARALAARFGKNFDGFNVGREYLLALSPVDDGKALHASIFFRDPSGRILVADELPHIGAIEAERRLKARFSMA